MSVYISCEPEPADQELAQKAAEQLEKYVGKSFIADCFEENTIKKIKSISGEVSQKYKWIICEISTIEIQISKHSPAHLLFIEDIKYLYIPFEDFEDIEDIDRLERKISFCLLDSDSSKEISDQMFNAFYKKVNSLHDAFLIVSNSILSDKEEK